MKPEWCIENELGFEGSCVQGYVCMLACMCAYRHTHTHTASVVCEREDQIAETSVP